MTEEIVDEDRLRILTKTGKSKTLASLKKLRELGFFGVAKHTQLLEKEVDGIIDHADLSITASKLREWASADVARIIPDLSITTSKLADLSVTTGKLAALSVTTPKVVNGAITDPKITSLSRTKLSPPIIEGLLADRPPAGVAGRWYWATDTQELFRDDGVSWNLVGELPLLTIELIIFLQPYLLMTFTLLPFQ